MLLIQIIFLGCPAVGDGEIAENIVEKYRCRNMPKEVWRIPASCKSCLYVGAGGLLEP